MKLYKVEGNTSSTKIKREPITGEEDITIIVSNIWNDKQAPVMLTVCGAFENYIKELDGHDYEERYMKKRFTYTSWCDLEQIEVLSKSGKVVKTISRDTPKEEYSKWIID